MVDKAVTAVHSLVNFAETIYYIESLSRSNLANRVSSVQHSGTLYNTSNCCNVINNLNFLVGTKDFGDSQ